jgi:hypothetical protein
LAVAALAKEGLDNHRTVKAPARFVATLHNASVLAGLGRMLRANAVLLHRQGRQLSGGSDRRIPCQIGFYDAHKVFSKPKNIVLARGKEIV